MTPNSILFWWRRRVRGQKKALGPWKGTEQAGGREDDLIQLYNLSEVLHCSFSSENKQRKAGIAVLWRLTQTNYNENYDRSRPKKPSRSNLSMQGVQPLLYISSDTNSFFPKSSKLPVWCSPQLQWKLGTSMRDSRFYTILLFLWMIFQKPKSSVHLSKTSDSNLILCLVYSSSLGQAFHEHMSIISWKATVYQRCRNFKNMIELISSYCN